MWIPPEDKDPVVFHHPTRKSVGYFGAVRLRDGRLVFRRQSERFNGETFWEFLRHLREATVEPGRRVILISDNAPYHRIQTPSRLAPTAATPVCLGLPSALQPGTESHRAGLEIDASTLPSQPLLRLPG